uniref:Uncharacterized protein n=1 Tax=Zea mays TaxID=4577 RepID=C4J484_MAIZE|nr:unknown [Zea mays]|eukprot:NP_001183183.1 uncharacterized protein LOC100501562 [Zea mays]
MYISRTMTPQFPTYALTPTTSAASMHLHAPRAQLAAKHATAYVVVREGSTRAARRPAASPVCEACSLRRLLPWTPKWRPGCNWSSGSATGDGAQLHWDGDEDDESKKKRHLFS